MMVPLFQPARRRRPTTIRPESSIRKVEGLVIAGLFVVLALAAGLWTGGGASRPTAPSGAMDRWVTRYGGAVSAISGDTATLSVDRSSQYADLLKTRADCTTLLAHVRRAQSHPPMPLQALQATWSSTLRHLAKGAQDCVRGIDERSAVLVDEAQMHFADAGGRYGVLVRAVTRS